MKVLMINSVCGKGSTGRICVDLCEILGEKEVETCVVYGRDFYTSNKINTFKMGGKINNYLALIETRLIDNHGFSSRIATKKLISFLETYKPDIIHLHNLHGYYINLEILFDYLRNSFKGKIIWTLHDCWSFSGHSAFIESYKSEGNRENINEYPKTYFFNFYSKNLERKKRVISKIDSDKMTIVTPSQWLSDMVKETYLNKFPVFVINNGVDQEIFKNIRIRKQNKKIILGVANIWDKRKGLDVMNFIANNIDLDIYEVLVVGKLEKKNELSNKIRHVEQTSNTQELSDIYNSSSVFVNPTYQDNFPTTNIEAISCGVPIVTFDTGGSGEVVENNKIGSVVKQGDLSTLLKEIEYHCENNYHDAIELYSKKYSKQNMLEKYLYLMEKIFLEGDV